MKSILFKNLMNNEKFICDDIQMIEFIDGIEYLLVRRPDNDRKFLMRKDILEKTNDNSKPIWN